MKKLKKIILPAIFALLVLFPIILRGGSYYVGGDDMRLYYVFPEKYLENFAFNLISGNTLAGAQTGYNSVSYFAPMFYFISFLKKISIVNVQSLMFGLNLAFGFLFFYLFVKELVGKKRSGRINVMIMFSSLIYIFSPFLIYTLLNHQMLNQYLISVMPAVLYFFYLSVKKEKVHYALLSVLIFTVFSATLNSLPWILGFVLGISPFLVYIASINFGVFFKNTLVSVISFIALNIHWIFHLVLPHFSNVQSGALSYYSSPEFQADNLRIIQGVSRLYDPLDILLLNADRLITNPFLEYMKLIIVTTIVLGGLVIMINRSKLKNIYMVGVMSLVVSWFLFSPNIGEWGPTAFLKMVNNIPFFTMFRNMQDKFALPLAFNFAFLFSVSFVALSAYWRKLSYILIALGLITVFIDSPRFFTNLNDNSYRHFSGEFEEGYEEILSNLEDLDDGSRVVWLPLNFPTYVNIKDANDPGQIYSGLSPMRVLIDRDDYTGTFSFMTDQSLFYGYEVFDLIKQERYEEVGEYFQKFNAGYVVIRKEELPTEVEEFMFGGAELPLLKMQDYKFIEEITGVHIGSFGNYQLYEINEKYKNTKNFLTEDTVGKKFVGTTSVDFRQTQQGEYLINLDEDQLGKTLVLLDPYSPYWSLAVNRNGKWVDVDIQSGRVDPLGNAFYIDPLHFSEQDKQIRIYFKPNTYMSILNLISIISGLGILFFVIYRTVKMKQ